MYHRTKLSLAALSALLILACAVGSASANRLSISNRNIRATWSRITFAGAGLTINCPLTIEGSFHSATISKVRSVLAGFLSRATVLSASCEGSGTASVPQASLPWHVRYDSFRGTLPSITGIRGAVVGDSFTVNIGFACLYISTAASPAFAIANLAAGTITGLEAESSAAIPLREGGFLCPSSGNFSGRGTATVLGSTTAITIRLI
jgi:hypothetical protein